MSPLLMALHLLNFMLPAIGLALLLALGEVIFKKKKLLCLYFIRLFAIYFFAALAVLLLGLALLGRDGRVLTYAVLTVLLAFLAAWRHR